MHMNMHLATRPTPRAGTFAKGVVVPTGTKHVAVHTGGSVTAHSGDESL